MNQEKKSQQRGYIDLDGTDWRDEENVIFDGTTLSSHTPAGPCRRELLAVKSADGKADIPVIRITGTAPAVLAWLLDEWTGGDLAAALDNLADGAFQAE